MSDIDPVNHPSHYQTFPEQEAIQIIEAVLTPEEYRGYLKGNFLKYRLRAGDKGPSQIDIDKSNWYKEELWVDYYDQCERDLEKFYGLECKNGHDWEKLSDHVSKCRKCGTGGINDAKPASATESTRVQPWTAPDYCNSESYDLHGDLSHDDSWRATDFGPCEHIWHKFVSTKTQRCADCGIEQPLSDNAGQVEHKRKSVI